MRPIVRILPYLIRIPPGKTVQPAILLVVTLHQLRIGRLAHRAQAYARACDCALAAKWYSAKDFREKFLLVEPIVEATQQGQRLCIAAIRCFQQAVCNPRARTGPASGT